MGRWPGTRGTCSTTRQAEAGRRLTALASLFDPWTFRHLEDLGIRSGWCCWEVGAGGPSVPAWMSDRVGPEGSVLATDIDLSWMGGSDPLPFEVRTHDVGCGPAATGALRPGSRPAGAGPRASPHRGPGRHGGVPPPGRLAPRRGRRPGAAAADLHRRVRTGAGAGQQAAPGLPDPAAPAGCRHRVRSDAAPGPQRPPVSSGSRPTPSSRWPARPAPTSSGPRWSRCGSAWWPPDWPPRRRSTATWRPSTPGGWTSPRRR